MTKNCDTYWGSHGCSRPQGHKGTHDCGCCVCPMRLHRLLHNYYGCVAKYPYYFGKDTKFYHMDDDDAVQGTVEVSE